MGLFSRFRKKKIQKADIIVSSDLPEEKIEDVEVPALKPQGISGVADCCEQILEAERQMEELKVEYQVVTSYLTDIQKIDLMPAENREIVNTAARNICIYTKEREKYKPKDSKLTALQMNMMEKQEKAIAKELKSMKANEEYNGIVRSDLRHLEGEKGALLYEKEETFEKQAFLKKTMITIVVMMISLLALIGALAAAFDKDMTIPYLLTVLLAALSATYIFIEENRNRRELKIIDRKLQKAIGLLNKVKIKYVNNRSLLEYSYEKYDVSSSAELDYLWKQYLIARENEKKYLFNSGHLSQAQEILKEELRRFDLSDAEIWTHQAEALMEKKEMVEVRHRLNVRRQKLRDNLDYNSKMYLKNKEEIVKFMSENRQMEEEVKDILRNYGICL